MHTASVHRFIEELTLNAWPPHLTLLFDGWVLGFADGYTRRANSIHPLYPSALPLTDKIATCEAAYAARGLPTVFKITSVATDADLDRLLDRRGYRAEGHTSVQTAALATDPSPTPVESASPHRADPPPTSTARSAASSRAQPQPASTATAGSASPAPQPPASPGPSPASPVAFDLATDLEPSWLADFTHLSQTPAHLYPPMVRLLRAIALPHAFARWARADTPVALGLAVAERGYVGLFDIVTIPAERNQGHARRLIATLLTWAQTTQSAHTAHLAVMCANAPARRLYTHLGFTEVYQYWYRVQPRVTS